MLRVLTALGATLVGACLFSAQAGAHIRLSEQDWLITGSTYSDDEDPHPMLGDRSDPVSVVWMGPSGATATIARAADHIEQHWRERRIPTRHYPRGAFMRQRNHNPFCMDPQWVFYREGSDNNVGRWAQSTAYMTTNNACSDQYHIRLWSSRVHGAIFGADHATDWVLSPIHHETATPPEGGVGHQPDLGFDSARSAYMHTMNDVHCVDRGWANHMESRNHQYGGLGVLYSGTISRVSFRHKAEGCENA
jgi:hypothetical protein